MAGNMLIVLTIIVSAGIAGGTVNIALSKPDRFDWRVWIWSVIAGIGAAFLIPLFLKTVTSKLLSGILDGSSGAEDFLVFGAFCLLAAISSKAFIQTLTDKVLKEVKEARQDAMDAKQTASEVIAVAKEAKNDARIAQDAADYGVTSKPPESIKRAFAAAPAIQPGNVDDDPWAGQFGGRSEANGRVLEARITQISDRPGWCSVWIGVRSTSPDKNPLKGFVDFYLHPTFNNSKPHVHVVRGRAELNLKAWGAFTVGAIADDGKTLLELDLAKHPDAKEPWKMR